MVAPRRGAACQRRSPVASGRSTPPPPHCRWKYMETILLTRSSVMWHTHSITAHGENILVWDDVLYGFLLGVESSYSLVISKQCYILSIRYICPFLLKILVVSLRWWNICMIQIDIIFITFFVIFHDSLQKYNSYASPQMPTSRYVILRALFLQNCVT